MKINIGDQVRVHFHPPCPLMSFVEGVVSRVNATLQEESLIVIDVTREVILDRERPVRRGHREYILYEHWNDFPGQIELLSEINQEVGTETPELPSQDAPGEMASPAAEEAQGEPQEKLASNPEETSSQPQAQVEQQEEARNVAG